MKSIPLVLLTSLAVFAGGVFAGQAVAEEYGNTGVTAPVVVELFTSQGCHSCPPADKYLGKLSEDRNVIALACHVTYWNYLGWKDTYSLPFCDHRQRAYRDSVRKRSAFTTQMVVNGRYEGVGSRPNRIVPLLEQAKKDASVAPLKLSMQGQKLTIEKVLDSASEQFGFSAQARTVLLGLGGKGIVDIKRGENWGKKLKYHHPVLVVHGLDKELNSEFNALSSVTRRVDNNTAVKTWVALVQNPESGEILAAGRYDI